MNSSNRNEIILNSLKDAQQCGRLAQSYLISCSNNEILDNFLTQWIPYIICTDKQGYQTCQKCSSCQKWQHQTYSSIHHLKSLSKSGQILVNNVQTFQQKFNFTSNDVIKIGVIHNAEKMIQQAQNSFLKTLEEPQNKTLFILLTQQSKKLLNTILSRCQHIALHSEPTIFDSPLHRQFLQILTNLHPRSGAATAIKCTGQISQLFEQIKNICLQETKENYADSNKSDIEAIAHNFYITERQKLLGLLEAWFYQLYINLNNQQQNSFQAYYPQDFTWSNNDILACLAFLQTLLKDYQSNLSEKLALNDFCLQICSL